MMERKPWGGWMRSAKISDAVGRAWRFAQTENVRAWRLPVLSVAVGVVAGLGAILFFYMLEGATWLFQECLAGYAPPGPGGEKALFPHVAGDFKRWVLFGLPKR
jgi:hypothetical protein